FDASGAVVASTLDRPDDPLARTVVAGFGAQPRPTDSDAPMLDQIACADGRCYVAYRRMPSRPGVVVAVVAATAELNAATRTVSRAIVIAALLSLTAMLGVSQVVAQRISAPLDELVRFTNLVAEGAPHGRAPVGPDEI